MSLPLKMIKSKVWSAAAISSPGRRPSVPKERTFCRATVEFAASMV